MRTPGIDHTTSQLTHCQCRSVRETTRPQSALRKSEVCDRYISKLRDARFRSIGNIGASSNGFVHHYTWKLWRKDKARSQFNNISQN